MIEPSALTRPTDVHAACAWPSSWPSSPVSAFPQRTSRSRLADSLRSHSECRRGRFGRLFLHSPVLSITVGGHGIAAPWKATAEELATNAPLWQRMHLADWNGIPRAVREPGLDAMLARYGNVLMDPSAWDTMTPEEWDDIPQPIRTVASRSHSRSNAHQ